MMMLANIGSPSQWFILILLCLLIFGAKRLPEIARALGRSLGEFRKARREFEDELMKAEQPETTKSAAPTPLENKASTPSAPADPAAQASSVAQPDPAAAGKKPDDASKASN